MKKVAISQYPRKLVGCTMMGYSVRNERWRLTLWRDRETQAIVFRELYDEKADPAETVNLAEKPEFKAVLEALGKFLPPPIEDTQTIEGEPAKTDEPERMEPSPKTSHVHDAENRFPLQAEALVRPLEQKSIAQETNPPIRGDTFSGLCKDRSSRWIPHFYRQSRFP
jgi:hypothetical protein